MLVTIDQFINTPIMSLQTGAELAKTSDAIIDPRKLVIVAFRVVGNKFSQDSGPVLFPEDIREISNIGFIVDSSERLMSTEGLVRLQQVIDFGFVLIGVSVEDEVGHKLGSVRSYAIDPESYFVQQLYIKPPFLKSLNVTELTIHRSQVISVNNQKIIVKVPTVTEKELSSETIERKLTNPFSPPTPAQPETRSND